MWKEGKQKLGPTHPLQEWMAIISMRLPSSTLQCSDTHNGECHASPCRSPREALLFEQHLDLTSMYSRLMTPLSIPSQLLISSLLSCSKPFLKTCSASRAAPSSFLSYTLSVHHIQMPPLLLLAKESSHLLLLEEKVCVLVGLIQSLQGELENQRGKSTRATGHLSLWVGRACSKCACPPSFPHIIPTPTPTFPDSLSLYTQHQPHTHYHAYITGFGLWMMVRVKKKKERIRIE